MDNLTVEIDKKRCSKCKELLPWTSEYFHKAGSYLNMSAKNVLVKKHETNTRRKLSLKDTLMG